MPEPDDAVLAQPVVWARALVVGVLAGTFGTVGHVMADGLLPAWPVLLVLLALCVPLSAPALMRPASRVRFAVLLVGGQAVVHLGLTFTGGHRGEAAPLLGTSTTPTPTTGPATLADAGSHRVGSLMDAYQASLPAGSGSTSSGGVLASFADVLAHLVADAQAHAPMMAAHLVAAALVGLCLGHGEAGLWTLVALLGAAGRLWTAVRHVVVAHPSDLVGRPVVLVAVRRLVALGDGLTRSRRGPPVAIAAP